MGKSICVACDGFPYKDNANFSFVKELCEEFSRQNIDVTVFAPQSLLSILFRGTQKLPYYYEFPVECKKIKVFRPLSLSFGQKFLKIQYYANYFVIKRTIKKHHLHFDAYYGHFWHSAFQLYKIAKEEKKNLFVASGESHIFLGDNYSSDDIPDFFDYVKYVICVSSKNKEESVKLNFCPPSKAVVIPNAVNLTHFYKIKNKSELRKKYGLASDLFIVAFLGAFIHRKGADRVSEAILKTEDDKIKGIFIGKVQDGNADCSPKKDSSVFIGALPHNKVVDYLNCADVFVLPTLQEGCSNAIIEAMACGLPVISSDRSFNYDILNSRNSILIDPLNIDEIKDAILTLKNNSKLLSSLSEEAYKKAQSLSITQRTATIKSLLFD